jgi:hypothetical protein
VGPAQAGEPAPRAEGALALVRRPRNSAQFGAILCAILCAISAQFGAIRRTDADALSTASG